MKKAIKPSAAAKPAPKRPAPKRLAAKPKVMAKSSAKPKATAKSSPKPKSREAQGQAELIHVVAQLAQSAEKLAQAAERLAQAAVLNSATAGTEQPEHQDEVLERAAEVVVVDEVDEVYEDEEE